ncbi:PREDICTED: putative nuclease HARBI1 [Rhagoletis zephyria]|uniref:putative nuclease HARBI1 n=1 Tax=Rhagoletis zephyria TaxID=28612 RepID=UPI000811419E|nr:PREDICTED: putative nuclease HARBI1 [Rhagoletis zephyria]XP_036343739.1 putative nuclease HARBI1 [Rhagoletis pomonella]XP_036343740.1 putative nuclease HARBI1 [Rhagoletis pomonella]
MAIWDHNMVITFVNARHPGANHDSFVWNVSHAEQELKSDSNNGKTNTWLLGDSCYPLQPYLMTPFRSAADEMQRIYNTKHSKARNVIERCFGEKPISMYNWLERATLFTRKSYTNCKCVLCYS